ncbi:MAG: beta-lactamase family protein, partial [Fidelibacterota bacterium]
MSAKSMLPYVLGAVSVTLLFAENGYLQQEDEWEPFLQDEQPEIRSITSDGYIDEAVLDSFIIATMDQYHIPGLSACILRDGEIIRTYSYGYANVEEGREVTDSTTFILASVSKTITATAIMQLWEKGLFGLDDNINNYLPPELQIIHPAFPDVPITFRQLLTHTSSIDYDWWFCSSYDSWGSDSPVPLDTF